MKKSRTMGLLVLLIVVYGLLAYTVGFGWGETKTGSAENIKLGLDLAGGVSVTYQTIESNPDSEDLDDTVYKLQKRAESYSTEAEVYKEGSNRINIDIPGVSNAEEVLEDLGNPGSLYFMTEAGEIVLTGTDVSSARGRTGTDRDTNIVSHWVELQLTNEGAEKFAEATQANKGKSIAIIYDGELVSSPTVESVITDGQARITGMESFEAADELASMIRIGALKLELETIRSNVVGAKLGIDAIDTSLLAGLIGLILIMIFMIAVYRIQGVAASLALAGYVGLMLFVLNAFDITLTLPGIAGIILSVGMAVDANVIVFERVKEELTAGKNVETAIRSGYQKALSAIIDGNVTTLIAAAVLAIKGSGTVKGFAQTLAIGIILSMITALLVTRVFVSAFYLLGCKKVGMYGVKREARSFDFIGKKKICGIISGAVILAGIVFMVIHGVNKDGIFNYSLDFVGGSSTTVTFEKELSLEEINEQAVPIFEKTVGADVQTQAVRDTTQVIFKTRTLSVEERQEIYAGLEEAFNIDTEKIGADDISSTVSSEMKTDAVVAVILATIGMLIYIRFRFKDFRFAGSSVLALVHDVLVVLAFYAIARVSVGNTFIACMLTIVGYSINATIVIFDRIRENLNNSMTSNEETLKEIANKSIAQTFTRSIYTSLTTFIMVFFLYILGVSSVKEFALPLMIGIICGAYSSIFLAGALWQTFRVKFPVRKED